MNTPLKELMDEHHVNQTALADAIGVSRQSVKKWLDGNTITYPNLQKLSSYFGATVPQLTGDEALPQYCEVERASQPEKEGWTRVPVLDIDGSCGYGADTGEAFVVGAVDFSDAFLRALPGVTGITQFEIVHATGDSMEPTINNRGWCVVDRNQPSIRTDGIYCIQAQNQIFLKRVQRGLDGSVTLISDNPRYAPYHLPTEALASTRIIGRVVYIFNGHNA